MSWFYYGDIASRRRRKNVALRPYDLPEPLLRKAKKLMRPRETIELCMVREIRDNDQVLLEFSSREQGVDPINRHTRFTFLVPEDPKWVCEGDVGRGWRDGDAKKPVTKKKKAKK